MRFSPGCSCCGVTGCTRCALAPQRWSVPALSLTDVSCIPASGCTGYNSALILNYFSGCTWDTDELSFCHPLFNPDLLFWSLEGHFNGRNEIQRLSNSGSIAGTFAITFNGQTTGAIAHNATAAQVQTALELLSNIDPGDVAVTGGPFNFNIDVEFKGQYFQDDVPLMTIDNTLMVGGTVSVATTQTAIKDSWKLRAYYRGFSPDFSSLDYVLNHEDFDCLGPNTFTKTGSDDGKCSGWPATITISPA